MCGIAGIISPDPSLIQDKLLYQMAGTLAHRGPDEENFWISRYIRAGFAHRRLCVIDISEEAGQPMHYAGRYTIVHNGEIYNYLELRDDLIKRGYNFRTFSDTEVILAAYSEYAENCVNYFDGMFAFAIWDEESQELFCARDRFGEKPFYYYFDSENKSFYFASEMKGLYAAGIRKTENHHLLLRFLALGHTNDPTDLSITFDARIKKLPASHTLTFSIRLSGPVIKKYWDLSLQEIKMPLSVAAERLYELLTVSVTRRLRSDVPVGTSLSGGLDSSSIAAIVNSIIPDSLKTFTASFPGFEKDESDTAARIAAQFGMENYKVAPTAEGFIDDLERLLYYQEEPFTSSSVYAQYKVFQLAAQENVTVLLDGQGADETLAGYDRYRSWRWRALYPRLISLLLVRKEEWKLFRKRFIGKEYLNTYATGIQLSKPVVKELNDLLYYNTFYQGLEELLRYADRNSMAHGAEVRLPYLSHELVSFLFSLPAAYKIGDGYTKRILRETMKNKLPVEVISKKRKTGFEPPQREWMEHPRIVDFAQEAKRELVKKGILDKKVLELKTNAHGAYDKNTSQWRWLIAGGLMIYNKKGV